MTEKFNLMFVVFWANVVISPISRNNKPLATLKLYALNSNSDSVTYLSFPLARCLKASPVREMNVFDFRGFHL